MWIFIPREPEEGCFWCISARRCSTANHRRYSSITATQRCSRHPGRSSRSASAARRATTGSATTACTASPWTDATSCASICCRSWTGSGTGPSTARSSSTTSRPTTRLHVGGYSGTAGDAFNCGSGNNLDGMQFTTWDRDNDNYPPANCANKANMVGAFWMNACAAVYVNMSPAGSLGFSWCTLPVYPISCANGALSTSRMTIVSA